MINDAIKLLTKKINLTSDIMKAVMGEIMTGTASFDEISSFLTTLKEKTETPDEIAAAASVLREKAIPIRPKVSRLIDTCGTGGDGLYTFNISTIVSLVLAAYGIPVAKHGNRSVSSSCGSADLIESLGIPLIKDKNILEKAIEEVGFGYIFAPYYHPAMKYAMPVRKHLRMRTIFNILGPLANPANPNYQILGVYDKKLLDPVANALKNLNLNAALIVYANDGMDEISIFTTTSAKLLKNGEITDIEIMPIDLNYQNLSPNALKVSNLIESKEKAEKVLNGINSPELDAIALNAGWTLFMLDEVKNPREGYEKIKVLLKDKKVLEKLNQIRAYFKNVYSE
ncbi:MAG: anthranilate phosphoribosyltransferase [Candidatus Saelkia tenebricola]|nr:anthranilate phosphoribosyltransferase [Candidatus Saelkia tenebricola]